MLRLVARRTQDLFFRGTKYTLDNILSPAYLFTLDMLFNRYTFFLYSSLATLSFIGILGAISSNLIFGAAFVANFSTIISTTLLVSTIAFPALLVASITAFAIYKYKEAVKTITEGMDEYIKAKINKLHKEYKKHSPWLTKESIAAKVKEISVNYKADAPGQLKAEMFKTIRNWAVGAAAATGIVGIAARYIAGSSAVSSALSVNIFSAVFLFGIQRKAKNFLNDLSKRHDTELAQEFKKVLDPVNNRIHDKAFQVVNFNFKKADKRGNSMSARFNPLADNSPTLDNYTKDKKDKARHRVEDAARILAQDLAYIQTRNERIQTKYNAAKRAVELAQRKVRNASRLDRFTGGILPSLGITRNEYTMTHELRKANEKLANAQALFDLHQQETADVKSRKEALAQDRTKAAVNSYVVPLNQHNDAIREFGLTASQCRVEAKDVLLVRPAKSDPFRLIYSPSREWIKVPIYVSNPPSVNALQYYKDFYTPEIRRLLRLDTISGVSSGSSAGTENWQMVRFSEDGNEALFVNKDPEDTTYTEYMRITIDHTIGLPIVLRAKVPSIYDIISPSDDFDEGHLDFSCFPWELHLVDNHIPVSMLPKEHESSVAIRAQIRQGDHHVASRAVMTETGLITEIEQIPDINPSSSTEPSLMDSNPEDEVYLDSETYEDNLPNIPGDSKRKLDRDRNRRGKNSSIE